MGVNDLFGIPRHQDPPRSEVWLRQGNATAGVGSVGTKIRCFSLSFRNMGSDITYVPSTVYGDKFLINTPGNYHIYYSDYNGGAINSTAITIDQPDLTTSPFTTPDANVLDICALPTASANTKCVYAGYLEAGVTIRANTNASATATNTDGTVCFHITKMSS